MLKTILAGLRARFHPLHRLRRSSLFGAFTRRADVLVWRRLPGLAKPISLRLVSNFTFVVSPGEVEPELREAFAALLTHLPSGGGNGCFWDVGANIGMFTWSCASRQPGWEIVSFEPDAKNLACLRRTARRWVLPHHRIVPCAVAESAGRAAFLVDELAGATGTLEGRERSFNYLHYGLRPPTVEIETVTLDGMIASGARPPDLIKIDVEGAEPRVLAGARRLLSEHRPVLLLECFDHRDALLAELAALDYACFDSDSRTAAGPATHNLLALSLDRSAAALLAALRGLGYPIPG